MKKIIFTILITSILSVSCNNTIRNAKETVVVKQLRKGFTNPPVEARPRAYWDWVDGNFSLDEITHEMEEAKAKGMGGFDIWDVSKVVDEKNIVPAGPAFMSDDYLIGIIHAINEAERLDLDLGLVVSSGWNAGGKWTKPEHQTMGLFRSEKVIEGGQSIDLQLSFPVIPKKVGKSGEEETAYIPRRENGLPEYYSEVKVIAIPESKDTAIIKKSMVLDISDKMDKDGNLKWEAPKGKWKIIRYVCTNTGQPMISSTPNSSGPMIDHFNPEATEKHINFFIEQIESKLGKPIGESGLKHFYTDSYEVVGLLWTEKLIDEFEKRMGYSMVPFLPIFDGFSLKLKNMGGGVYDYLPPSFDGYIIENENVTKRFLYDFRKVWSDIIIDSHYKKATEICESNGIEFVAEAAGPGIPIHNCPFESLKASGNLSFPRGEFWHVSNKNEFFRNTHEVAKNRFLNELQVLKGVASASHIYNQKYVEAEAFTGLHIYTEGPGDLKHTADRAFCEGLNRIIFHTWPHTPKKAGEPGWAYPFGTLMNETRIWWPMAKPWMDYLARNSFMLQQGNFVGDVLYYYGDSVPNFVPAKHINPTLGFGYDYDVTNTDILVNKLDVIGGKLSLPNGQKYEILVLPEERYMVYDVLEKIENLIKSGATVVGPKPIRSHGLKDWKEHDKKVIELADKIWGKCDGKKVTENNYGKGKVVWGKSLKEVMDERNIDPDFDFTGNVENINLDFIHRSIDGAEIYFISNTTNQKVFGNAIFRIEGMQPEIWSPVNSSINNIEVFSTEKGKTTLPLSLEANGSVFIVFTSDIKEQINKVVRNGKQIFPKNETGIKENSFFEQNGLNGEKLSFYQPGKYVLNKANGESTNVDIDEITNPIELDGAWQVHFPEEKKGVGDVMFDSLYSWTKSDTFDIKFFSGIATYEKEFEISSDLKFKDLDAILDLGTVFDVAHVYINGKDAGISWVKPNKVNISDFIQTGKNTIKVEIANTWHNRLCGDAKLPKPERITKSNITRLPNPWAFPMKEIPSKNIDLQSSGLLGPVTINFIHTVKINNE